MPHPNTLELTQAALVIVDMQEAFRTRIDDFNETVRRIMIVTQAAKLLQLPIIVTEQYPKGLGHTASEIIESLPETVEILEKTTFSSCGATAFQSELENTRATQVLVCGLEAHICVNQTVHDLLANHFQVHLLTDCITSRKQSDKQIALAKMQISGAIPASVEMALFELLRDARHEQFRTIQGLIK